MDRGKEDDLPAVVAARICGILKDCCRGRLGNVISRRAINDSALSEDFDVSTGMLLCFSK